MWIDASLAKDMWIVRRSTNVCEVSWAHRLQFELNSIVPIGVDVPHRL